MYCADFLSARGPAVKGDAAVVARFLRENAPAHFCSSCIGIRLEVGVNRARSALATLAREVRIESPATACSECGGRTLTYWLPSDGETPP